MLLCLLGLVWVLRQSGPGRGSALKRRALKNVVAVMVPAVVAYSPLVALVPYVSLIGSSVSCCSSQTWASSSAPCST
ncbi:hypothetical protein VZT92_024018 [Zoarces viviparus]|uniref:Uncharacterized protein n=1 Tax=Zoarces viviparus TaxID=48416 RepID=A0AAW1E1Y2_ZOAVI